MGGEGGTPPAPPNKPQRQTLCCCRPPLCTLRGDEHLETKPSSFGRGEHKVPVGLEQAVLAVLPQAFQSGGLPGSWGLWWSVLPAHGALSGVWVGFGEGGLLPGAGKGQRAERTELWQCSGGWMRDVLSKPFKSTSGIQDSPANRSKASTSAGAGG